MKTLNLTEKRILLFKKILSIENEDLINKLFVIVDKFLTETVEVENHLEDVNFSSISFDEWSEIFMEDRNLNEYIPEYDMTIGEYRKKIYESEISESFPVENFLKKLEKYV